MNLRDVSNQDFNTLFKVMPIYEEDNMMCYTGGKVEKLVFTETAKNEESLKCMDELRTNLKNPLEWMYWWCRGEIYDLKALRSALEQRDQLEKHLLKLKQKVAELKEDLENITQGKSSMRTMFKSASDTQYYEQLIQAQERDIENYQQLHDVITVHLGRDAIGALKKRKLKIFRQMLQSFSIAEISNAHMIASFWNKIADHKYVLREVLNQRKMKEVKNK